jgi:hypothetical protein
LCSLSLFQLFVDQLCSLFLPLLGPCLLGPFFCQSQLSLAHLWFLGHLDFWRLCFCLFCLSFYCCFRHFPGNGWDPPFIMPFIDDHVDITLFDAVAHLYPLFMWILPWLYPHCLSCGPKIGDVHISHDSLWCYYL